MVVARMTVLRATAEDPGVRFRREEWRLASSYLVDL